MATQHICPEHPETPGAWVDGGVANCALHGMRAKPNFSPGLRRLKKENASGVSSRDVERSVIEEAKKDGRDLYRPSDFPQLKHQSSQ